MDFQTKELFEISVEINFKKFNKYINLNTKYKKSNFERAKALYIMVKNGNDNKTGTFGFGG